MLKNFCVAAILTLLSSPLLAATVPHSSHVVLLVEENHSYSSVIGSSSMPYLNSLAKEYGLMEDYYANTHPSIGNYFELTTGQIITNDDNYTGTVKVDNIVRHLLTAGKTWKSYAESLPYTGYTGGNTSDYLKHHNPFAYFSDVVDSSVEKQRLVPFTEFAKDLHDGSLPEFSYIAPNIWHDAHNGTLAQADAWLKANIPQLLSNAEFKKDGILIIVFDESFDSDTAHGGGHIPAIVIGPGVKKGYRSTSFYQHQSTLKAILEALGVSTKLGNAATADPLYAF